ncbi:MAG: SusC/RagA family TonB-linked outer membrane protein [Saprospiraceae bacterium]|nr:SusC/RagA family TonB-linked outer membrane protein [Saprospiraceae bacterium]
MKQRVFILLFFLTAISWTYSQKTVSGKVSDAAGLPLIGANVTVKLAPGIGTISDVDGKFSLSVPSEGSILIFSYTGYETKEVSVGASSVLNVSLNEGKILEEVVVTALGIGRKEKSVGYSVSQVESSTLREKAEPDLLKTLQGRVPGVDIRTSQGSPGAATRIQIRGNSSFGLETQPLIVVDGVPYSNVQVTTSSQTSGGGAYGSGISGLDPNDIESFNVLKGAAAAAIYGSRGSRGVILITTKSGSSKKRDGFKVNYRTSTGIENVSNLPDFQNKYGAGVNFAYANANGSWGPKFGTIDSIAAWPEYLAAYPELFSSTGQTPFKAYPDNVKNLFRTGHVVENSISIEGGTAVTSFSLTASNLNHTGYVENSYYKRNNIGVGGSTVLWKGVTLGGNLSFMKGEQLGGFFGENQVGGAASQFARSLFLARNWDLELPYQDASGKPLIPNGGAQFDNPHWAAYNNIGTTIDERVISVGKIKIDILKNLVFNYNLGNNIYRLNRTERTQEFSRAADGLGRIIDQKYSIQELESTATLSYNTNLTSDLDISASLGQNMNRRSITDAQNTGLDFIVPGIYNLKNTASQSFNNDDRIKRSLIGVFGEIQLGYKSMAYLNLGARNDWSSTLPIENRSYFYPTVSGSFILSELMESNLISYAKIRAGWAKVGNDAPPYRTQDVFTLDQNFRGAPRITRSSNTNDPNLSPEFTTELELGADLRLWKDRFSVDFTWYDKKTTDLIFNISVPNTTGFNTFTTNVGEISNKGIEVGLNLVPILTKDFEWSFGVSFTKNKNLVVSLIEGVDRVQLNPVLTTISPFLEPGLPFGYLRGTKAVRDSDGNPLINPNTGGMIVSTAQGMIGDPNPDFKMGINTEIKYKNLFLNGLFDMTKGGDIYSVSVTTLLARGVTKDTEDREKGLIIPGNYADPANLQSGLPLLVDGKPVANKIPITLNDIYFSPNPNNGATFGFNSATEFNVFDGTVYRLRELTLGYSLPASLFGVKYFKGGTLSVSGRNLFFLAPNLPKHSNFDPEVNSFGATTTQGIELSAAPTSRRYAVNLNINF